MPSHEAEQQALLLKRRAEQDELVLLKLLDDPEVHDHVLGFHAQQAVEKRLKAVLALHEVEFRWTHSVAYLTALLEESEILPPACRTEIEALSPWASRARYEDVLDVTLDRPALHTLVMAVKQWSESLIGPTDWISGVALVLKHLAKHGGLDHLALLVERDREAGALHVTLDGSVWAGSTTALIISLLVAELDPESGTKLDMSKEVDILKVSPGGTVELRSGLASIAHNVVAATAAKQVLVFGRLDDFSFLWVHATPKRVVVGASPPDALSRLLLGIDAIADEPVGGGIFDKPDPDVRFSGGTTVALTELEIEFFEQLREDFREKFGRDPEPDDPVFFDPTADEPRPMSKDQLTRLEVIVEEIGATEISKQMAAAKVLSGMVQPAGGEQGDAPEPRRYEDVNPLPLLVTLEQAAALEGDPAQRCVYAAVHSWAEGHLSAPGHPEPEDTDEPLHVPPFPSRDGEALHAIVAEALGRFHGNEGIDVVAYAAALAWKAGRAEGVSCQGCAIEHGSGAISRAMRDGEMDISFHPRLDDRGDSAEPSPVEDDMDSGARLDIVAPAPPPEMSLGGAGTFRVSIRAWDENLLEADEYEPPPLSWTYYLEAETADEARKMAIDRFPGGATVEAVDDDDDVRLDRMEICRISVDVQRVGMPQGMKEGASYYLIGDLEGVPDERLGQLAGCLEGIFPAAVVALDGGAAAFGVTVHAESHDEAQADVEDVLTAFAQAVGLGEDLLAGWATGQGRLAPHELAAQILGYRQRYAGLRPSGS